MVVSLHDHHRYNSLLTPRGSTLHYLPVFLQVSPLYMPSYNITIDDASPFIRYSGQWTDAARDDPSLRSYQELTYHASGSNSQSGQLSKAELSFNGTAVYVFGGKRSNHGEFQIAVDGESQTLNGLAEPDEFRALLYSKIGLDPDFEHTLVLTNTDAQERVVDIDFITVTLGDGQPSEIVSEKIDDTDPIVHYTSDLDFPRGGPPEFLRQAYNNTYAATKVERAFFTIIFFGNAVSIYGGTAGNHGLYSVSLDQGAPQSFNGSCINTDTGFYRGQQLLFMGTRLERTVHTVTVMNMEADKFLDLDYFVRDDWGDPASSNDSEGSSHLSPSAIAGIAIGGVTLLFVVFLGLMWWKLRKGYQPLPGSEPQGRSFPFRMIVDPYLNGPIGDQNNIRQNVGWTTTGNPKGAAIPLERLPSYSTDL